MGKIIRLTESELKEIIETQTEKYMNESILDTVGAILILGGFLVLAIKLLTRSLRELLSPDHSKILNFLQSKTKNFDKPGYVSDTSTELLIEFKNENNETMIIQLWKDLNSLLLFWDIGGYKDNITIDLFSK